MGRDKFYLPYLCEEIVCDVFTECEEEIPQLVAVDEQLSQHGVIEVGIKVGPHFQCFQVVEILAARLPGKLVIEVFGQGQVAKLRTRFSNIWKRNYELTDK